MGLLDVTPIARRKMNLFFLVDVSKSMQGNKIASVNESVANAMTVVKEISEDSADAEIVVSALKFSSGVEWLYDNPRPATDFRWQEAEAFGLTSLGEALLELESKLHRNAYMASDNGYVAPVIILLSDGEPTDNFREGLEKLRNNNWFKQATKIAIAIGNDADKDVLKEITGNIEAVFTVHNLEQLRQVIHIVTVTSSQIGSQNTGSGNKQDQIVEQVKQNIEEVSGNSDDDWD